MTFDAAYASLVGDLLGIWLSKLSFWLGSQPMLVLFVLTILVYLCKAIRTLAGR